MVRCVCVLCVGTIEFLDGERILVTHLINSKFRGEALHHDVASHQTGPGDKRASE